MNHDLNEKALALHKEHHGKLETKSKVKLDSREILSLAYSPGVGAVSVAIGNDKTLAREYTLKNNTVAVISDGSAILGLGNLGPYAAIPVMEGKAAIFKEFAGVDAFPICLNTQDTEEIISIIKNISPVFGGINLEDISAPRCFEIEGRLRKELDIPVMHDDQWGAATVTLVGLINATKLRGISKEETKIVLAGVGAAGVATGRLLISYGFTNITFIDSKGIITHDRNDLTFEKQELLNGSTANVINGDLVDALKDAHVFIGLSKANTVTQDMVRSMSERPILFTLSNPTPEIMPELARETGAFIVATGRGDYPNQINNSLVFPGAFKGMLQIPGAQFDRGLFMTIAEAIVKHHEQFVTAEAILPSMFDAEVVGVVEKAVLQYFA
ncbi:MAG: NADP-dependent malic enzyme [Patescibacteria group bacterium]